MVATERLHPTYGELFTAEVSNGGLVVIPGGVPLRNMAGAHVGSIGVSTGVGGTTADPADSTISANAAKAAQTAFYAPPSNGATTGIVPTPTPCPDGGTSTGNYKSAFVAMLVISIALAIALAVTCAAYRGACGFSGPKHTADAGMSDYHPQNA